MMEETFSNRFRTKNDICHWLMRYWQFAGGKFKPGNPGLGQFFSIGRDDAGIKRAILSKVPKIICLSDDDENMDFEEEKLFLRDCFEAILPNKSSYEI